MTDSNGVTNEQTGYEPTMAIVYVLRALVLIRTVASPLLRTHTLDNNEGKLRSEMDDDVINSVVLLVSMWPAVPCTPSATSEIHVREA